MVAMKIAGAVFLAFLYLVSPIDCIPDVIPVLGLGDDVGVIAYTWSFIKSMLSKSTT